MSSKYVLICNQYHPDPHPYPHHYYHNIRLKCQWLLYRATTGTKNIVPEIKSHFVCGISTSTAVSTTNHMDILPGGPHMLPSQECIGFHIWISQVEAESKLTSWAHISSLFSVKGLALNNKLAVAHWQKHIFHQEYLSTCLTNVAN